MGTEYVAVGFTILFTIATSLLLGRYMFNWPSRRAERRVNPGDAVVNLIRCIGQPPTV